MAFQFDTSGVVAVPTDDPQYIGERWVTFPDLSPFMQGYVMAAFESLPFFHMECPSCEWDCVIGPPKVGDLGICCPLCAADNGRDVRLRTEARVSRDWTGTVEGSDDRKKGFSDLAPATIAAMMADCEGIGFGQGKFYADTERQGGHFWNDRQHGSFANFPPLTLTIHDDGLVYQEARS